jgi:serine/threonine protein kinase
LYVVDLRHFKLGRSIGRGAFGKVKVVIKRDTKKLYALKYINKEQCIKKRAYRNIFRERALLENIEHPFIVNLRFAFQDDENMVFFLFIFRAENIIVCYWIDAFALGSLAL